MNIERVHEGVRYTLTNDNINTDDEVYPIAWGRQAKDGWILNGFKWKDSLSDFPDCPHIVKGVDIDSPTEKVIRTNFGYSHAQCYYKIIKVERQVKVSEDMFGGTWEWQEFDKAELNIKAIDPSDLPF